VFGRFTPHIYSTRRNGRRTHLSGWRRRGPSGRQLGTVGAERASPGRGGLVSRDAAGEAYALRREGWTGARGGGPGSIETVSELGAPSTRSMNNPNSRLGLASPHSQGRVWNSLSSSASMWLRMASTSTFGPLERPFSVPHDDAGLAGLAGRLTRLHPTLVALEATGGYEVPRRGRPWPVPGSPWR